jgi:hypothetical protein
MRLGKLLALASAATLMCAPIAAQAATASKSVAASKVQRAGIAKKSVSKLGGEGGSSTLIAIGAAIAVIVGIVLLTDDDSPSSP